MYVKINNELKNIAGWVFDEKELDNIDDLETLMELAKISIQNGIFNKTR